MGGPFAALGTRPYVPSGRFGGVRDGEWVKSAARRFKHEDMDRLAAADPADFYANERYRKEAERRRRARAGRRRRRWA